MTEKSEILTGKLQSGFRDERRAVWFLSAEGADKMKETESFDQG